MDSLTGSTIAEIAFYTALAVLLGLFLVKKFRQVRNAEKENLGNKP
jgi:hypothetical protein